VLDELNAMLNVLRDPGEPAALSPTPALADVDRLIESVRAAGRSCELTTKGDLDQVSAPLSTAAYRIVQESLTNVLRHAGPRARAHAVLRCGQEIVAIEVADDGVGPGSTPGSGHGLAGMRERAEALGGVVDAGPRPGGGFAVRATLPRGRSR
jgi:signal transduction histidine kinase